MKQYAPILERPASLSNHTTQNSHGTGQATGRGNQAILEQVLREVQGLSDDTTTPTTTAPWKLVHSWAPQEQEQSKPSSKRKHALGSAEKQRDESSYSSQNGDNDGDKVRNRDDSFPNDPRTWRDSDLDGVGDALDHFPKDPKEWFDSDADGKGDNTDKEFTGPARKMSVDKYMGDGTYGQQVRFDMTMNPNKEINIELRVKLNGPQNTKTQAEWEKSCEKMWSQGGIKLDVKWVKSGAHKEVGVSRGSGRANSGHWYTQDDGLTVAHEVGHLLGLNDEYADGNDSHRLIGEEDSVMRIVWGEPRPYPRHIDWLKRFWDPKKSKPVAGSSEQKMGEDSHRKEESGSGGREESTGAVTPPSGYQKYLASRESYRERFAKKIDGNGYIAHHQGTWLEWVENVSDTTLKMRHPDTGDVLIVEASELAIVKADNAETR